MTLTVVPILFQFPPLREGRRALLRKSGQARYFNSRPSARGDPHNRLCFRHHPHFNSRPSARGDQRLAHVVDASQISIPAPPRGATRRCTPDCRCSQFQFPPLREGRQTSLNLVLTWYYFNSRPSARGDDSLLTQDEISESISIHAPPRGATTSLMLYFQFNQFQFTPLREGRRTSSATSRRKRYFNSRPSARGDEKRKDEKHV